MPAGHNTRLITIPYPPAEVSSIIQDLLRYKTWLLGFSRLNDQLVELIRILTIVFTCKEGEGRCGWLRVVKIVHVGLQPTWQDDGY